jgi:hypothetical protein
MRIEKLVYVDWPERRRFLHLVVTRGKAKLATLAVDVVRTLRRLSRPRQLRLILDAGASVSNDGLRRLDRCSKTVLILRAPRRSAYVNAWKRLPAEAFSHHEEPGRYVGAKLKEIAIAETTTLIQGIAQPVRTLVVRERAMRGKDRWHALFLLHEDTTSALDLLQE